MDTLLKKSKALYRDREKIAFSTMLIVFTVVFYLLYSPGISTLFVEPPIWIPWGWTEGLEVVVSINTFVLLAAVVAMFIAYSLWSWAFLPSPAAIYTVGVLRGILGPSVAIKQRIGKRFRVLLENGNRIDISCRIKEHDSGDWFVYQLKSSPIFRDDLEYIALRHGMSVRNGCFTTIVSNDELHHRTILLAKAIASASPQ
ncbi:MAG: hypothetical protein EAX95_11560 [Candidatus Thorarchaeota archaeon]|nr:hypothetical protein [Candidatus Thorarchaeota archaeon]